MGDHANQIADAVEELTQRSTRMKWDLDGTDYFLIKKTDLEEIIGRELF